MANGRKTNGLLRAIKINDQVVKVKCNNEDCHVMIVFDKEK
ncbi:14854_t:CDS:2, partial [Gigaspora margarita]